MRIIIRILDWLGRAFDLKDLLYLLALDSFLTGTPIYLAWDWFKSLPIPVQWLYGAGLFLLILTVGGYVVQKIRKPEGPFLFDTEHFLKSIFVIEVKTSEKKFDGPTPHVTFSVQIVNGSGFQIEIKEEIVGLIHIRKTFLPSAEFVSSMCPLNLSIPYPQRGYFELRQFVSPDILKNEIEFANTPDARAIDRMLGDEYDYGPSVMFDFKEIKLNIIVRKGRLSHEFQMPLYAHSVEVVI